MTESLRLSITVELLKNQLKQEIAERLKLEAEYRELVEYVQKGRDKVA
jgi:hypothetical protein